MYYKFLSTILVPNNKMLLNVLFEIVMNIIIEPIEFNFIVYHDISSSKDRVDKLFMSMFCSLSFLYFKKLFVSIISRTH